MFTCQLGGKLVGCRESLEGGIIKGHEEGLECTG